MQVPEPGGRSHVGSRKVVQTVALLLCTAAVSLSEVRVGDVG
jgi:hypothetical protein